MNCPCGNKTAYLQCCGRWHEGPLRLKAPDAEQLMRSRYCAFVMNRIDYLLETWHPRTRPISIDASPPDLKWLGLEVRGHSVLDEHHASVEFVARCKQNGRATRVHEISQFERQGERWLYVDGAYPGSPERRAR